MQVGKPERWDYEYHREGTANLFMFFAPLQNWRHVEVTAHRTKQDWAKCMHDLVYVYFPQAERCVLVEDNLNTHDPSALYEVFHLHRLKAFWIAWNFISRPNMVVGSIWPRSN